MRLRRQRHADTDSGAAAVEFALVVPVLVLLLFGIIDYGLWFSDSLDARSGVREAARSAVVDDSQPCGSVTLRPFDGPAPSDDVKDIMCAAKRSTGDVTGDVYVAVQFGAGGWAPGEPLYVCESVHAKGVSGFVPLPHSGWVRSRSVMTIEQPAAGPAPTPGAEQLPAGQSWGWCTAS